MSSVSCAADGTQANVILILADDLAWSDLGCYGHRWHETPNLDRLAAEGLRFTDAYAAAPICSASRASILTGKTPARLNFEFVTKDAAGRQQLQDGQSLRTPPFTLNLPLEEITIAEHFVRRGYETAFFGKWHLNAHHGGYLGWSPTHGPPQQGFQTAVEDFGSHPYRNREHGKLARVSGIEQFHPDSMTAQMCEYVKSKHDGPFFLYACHFYVHTPVETPYDWLLAKYEKLVPTDTPNRKNRIRYAAFLETLDHYVGQLLRAIDEAGLRDETLVVFTSDNGGHPEYIANGPLRGSKWNLYEGGVRVPMIARWPGHLPAGEKSAKPVIGYDLLPTFRAISGGADDDPTVIDGDGSILTSFEAEQSGARPLYWHFPYYHPEAGYTTSLKVIGVDDFAVSQTRPQSAIRVGNWKLIHFYEGDYSELYDLSTDISEQHDLANTRPDVASQLRNQLLDYLYGDESAVHARRPEPVH